MDKVDNINSHLVLFEMMHMRMCYAQKSLQLRRLKRRLRLQSFWRTNGFIQVLANSIKREVFAVHTLRKDICTLLSF